MWIMRDPDRPVKATDPLTRRLSRWYARVMMRATWNGAVLAESDHTRVVENNHYFPVESVHKERFQPSATHTTCGWKGEASYYDVVVDGKVNKDAAWFYPSPKEAAKQIAGYVAFWRGVEVASVPDEYAPR